MGRKGGSGVSGGGGSGGSGGGANVDRVIERTAFAIEGNGNWQLDIPGVGGGQILDETGGSRDPMFGRGGKVYSITTWGPKYDIIGTREYFSSLNESKRAVRNRLRSYHGNFG